MSDGEIRPGHTLGVAIEIASPAREVLAEAQARFDPDGPMMPPHVTIIAPIDVDADALPVISSHLRNVARSTAPFDLILKGAESFRPVTPVVFVAVSDGAAECMDLESRVRSGDMAVDLRYPYHPHVTIAHDVPDADLDAALDALAGFEFSQMVDRMGLYEHLDGRWVLLEEFSFDAR